MFKRADILSVCLSALSALFVVGNASATETTTQVSREKSYRIKPSDVQVPSGVSLGQYRRIIEPFPNWTLICDENLKTKLRICNVTQNIIDSSGANVFSWSLAASQNGHSFFILRAPPQSGVGKMIHLGLDDGGNIVHVKIDKCDQNVCVAYQNVGPRLRAAIKKSASVGIIFDDGSVADNFAFKTSFAGLELALSGIR